MPLMECIVHAHKKKWIHSFLRPSSRVLEIGSGSGWVRELLPEDVDYTGIDLFPPADVVGDIREWRTLGLAPESFDLIVAFEVVEHVPCFQECYDLLAPGGVMLCTTPVPHWDWMMKILENIGVNQKRTSPHEFLVDCNKVGVFEKKDVRRFLVLSQWAVFTKQSET